MQRMIEQSNMKSAFRMVASVAKNGWKKYSTMVSANGWRAQAINTGILMGTSDVIAQCLVERRRFLGKDYEISRTLRFGFGGFFVFGPWMNLWYTNLDRFVRVAKTPLRLAVTKMLCDQMMFFPVYLGGYISFYAVLENVQKKPLEIRNEVTERLEDKFKELLVVGYKIWPAVQMVNFYFVPLHHRIFVMNAVGLFYYTYMDWCIEDEESHEEKKEEKKEEVQEERKARNIFVRLSRKQAECQNELKKVPESEK